MAKASRDANYPAPPKWSQLYARYFPQHTDPSSRHVKTIAQEMRAIRSPLRIALIEAGYEPDHMASSLEATVEMLWAARASLNAREHNEMPEKANG